MQGRGTPEGETASTEVSWLPIIPFDPPVRIMAFVDEESPEPNIKGYWVFIIKGVRAPKLAVIISL